MLTDIFVLGATGFVGAETVSAALQAGQPQHRVLPALQGFNLLATPLHVSAPVTIFQGRHDAATVPALAVPLAQRVNAELVWFEYSAHYPHEEEPERFRAELLRFVEGLDAGKTPRRPPAPPLTRAG
jgi:pimeloyl-ACP methyl ester carboxylesterase